MLRGGAVPEPARALLVAPLVELATFHLCSQTRAWASHSLRLIDAPASGAEGPLLGGAGGVQPHGRAALAAASELAAGMLWGDARLAVRWAAGVEASLLRHTAANSSPQQQLGGADGFGAAAGALPVLLALLLHPAPRAQLAAGAALAAAVRANGLLGVSLIPALAAAVQRSVEGYCSGRARAAPATLGLLRVLPELARHSVALPYVVRLLQPLLAEGAPELVQAAGLRLLCRVFVATGRGYPQLRTAVLGAAPPGGRSPGAAPQALLLAQAQCVVDICQLHPPKGTQFVRLIQGWLLDAAPALQRAGLACVALLCEAGALEFYAAWRVVQAAVPKLPSDPGGAAAWVRLLAGGALDADLHPEAAASVVDALWQAAAHAEPLLAGAAPGISLPFHLRFRCSRGAGRAAHAAQPRCAAARRGRLLSTARVRGAGRRRAAVRALDAAPARCGGLP